MTEQGERTTKQTGTPVPRRTVLNALPWLVGLSMTPATGEAAMTTPVRNVSNENLQLYVRSGDSVGTFTIRTGDGQDLIYKGQNPGTSYLTVRIDGQNYVSSALSEVVGSDTEFLDEYVASGPRIVEDGRGIQTEWSLPEGLDVIQTITLTDEAAKFEVEIENTGSQDREVDIRYLFDYQVGSQDGAPIAVDGNVLTRERSYSPPNFENWTTRDSFRNPTLTGQGTIGIQPKTLSFVAWEDAVGYPYDYEGFESGKKFFTEGFTTSPESDSAGLLYWPRGTLPAGETDSIVTYYGVGSPKRSEVGSLERALDRFETAVSDLLSTFVRSKATLYARLYHSVGEEFAQNLINYFGYLAGVEGASRADVNPRLRSELDSAMWEVSSENAKELYRFFDEMFGAREPNASVKDLRSTFERYFWGTAQGQQHALMVEGKTLDETKTAFQDEFADKRSAALRELRQQGVSDDRLDTIIQFVESKRSVVANHARKTRERHEATWNTIEENREIRAHTSKTKQAGMALLAVGMINPGPGPDDLVGTIPGVVLLAKAGVTMAVLHASTAIYTGASNWTAVAHRDVIFWTNLQRTALINRLRDEVLTDVIANEAERITKELTGLNVEFITGLEDVPITLVEMGMERLAEVGTAAFAGVDIVDLSVNDLNNEDVVYDGNSKVARESATVTVKNLNDSGSIVPQFVSSTTKVTSQGIANFPVGVPVDAKVLTPSRDEVPEIGPGERATIDVEYLVPLDFIPGAYRLTVGMRADEFSLLTDTETRMFLDLAFPSVNVDVLGSGSIVEGATETFTKTFDDAARAVIDLVYGGSNLDFHLYDRNGNHVGRNYESGEVENQIDGVMWSGPDDGVDATEGFSIENPSGTYETEIVALDTSQEGADFTVTASDTAELGPRMQVVPRRIDRDATAGERITATVTVEEVGGFERVENASVTASELTLEDGDEGIVSENVVTEPVDFVVEAGGTVALTVAVEVPSGASGGTYTGNLVVESDSQSATVPLTVSVTEARTAEPRRLSVTKDGASSGFAAFVVTASDDVSPTENFEGVIEGTTALDALGPERGTDAVDVTGDVEVFALKGDTVVKLDGERVDVGTIGKGQTAGSGTASNVLEVTKEGAEPGRATFALVASGGVEQTEGSEATIRGRTAIDWVGPERGTDQLRFAGEIDEFLLKGPATVSVNGEQVDPDQL